MIINPGSTTTKTAVYEDEHCAASTSISHSRAELAQFANLMDQYQYRKQAVEHWLLAEGLLNCSFCAIVARGGLLRPIPSGTYPINGPMLADLRSGQYGMHASNLAALIAQELAEQWNIHALIADPVVVDELQPEARISGTPLVKRRSIFHALNQKAMARQAAKQLRKPYEELSLIVAHLGGGISVGAHYNGSVVDVNNALDGDGPLSPERSGTLPVTGLIEYVFKQRVSKKDLYPHLVGGGGLAAHLGSNDGREIERRIDSGDQKASEIYEALAYQIGKEIGRCHIVLGCNTDGVVLTGGLAFSERLCAMIRVYTDWMAPHFILPGEHEMQALAEAGVRFLSGTEQGRDYPSGRFL